MNLYISLTTKSSEELGDLPLSKSLNLSKFILDKIGDYEIAVNNFDSKSKLLYVYNNTTPICKAYNKVIIDVITEGEYDNIVFLHDDVCIEDRHLTEKVDKYLQQYDIIGLAGGNGMEIRKPCLWHIMCKERFGTVGHYLKHNNNTHWYGTTFGVSQQRVAVIDGLFIGVKASVFKKLQLMFDEDLPGFHHYDIKFCMDANALKFKIGVVPILVTHMSPGLKSLQDENYLKSEEIFYNKVK